MAANSKNNATALEIDRLAVQLAKDPHSKVFLPLAEEYCKAGMWQEAAGVLEDGLKYYPGFITAMVVLGRAYDQLGQPTKAKAILEEAVKLSPENLRAHRTLIKIYVAQGQGEAALKSCDVILGLNPRDEEALSIQAKLERPAKEVAGKAKKPVIAKTKTASLEQEPPVPSTATEAKEEMPVTGSLPAASQGRAGSGASPLSLASTIMESALQADDHRAGESIESGQEPREEAVPASEPSPHAETIAQLESFLRSIEQNRKDRRTSGEPSSSTS